MSCGQWAQHREALLRALNLARPITPEAIVDKATESEVSWEAMQTFCQEVLQEKEALERELERARAQGNSSEEEDLVLQLPPG